MEELLDAYLTRLQMSREEGSRRLRRQARGNHLSDDRGVL